MFEVWPSMDLKGEEKKLWYSLFFIIIWSLWGYRDSIIFDSKVVNGVEFMQTLKYRWRDWCRERSHLKIPDLELVFSDKITLKKKVGKKGHVDNVNLLKYIWGV